MHPKTIAKQIIDFNKAAFDSSFDAINLWESHAEKMFQLFVEKANFFPEDGKRALTEWFKTYKKGIEDYKAAVDNNFQNVEDYFIKTAENVEYSIYNIIEKTDNQFSEAARNIRNVSVAVVDKSITSMAGAPTLQYDKKVFISKDKGTKGKTGAGGANISGKAGKKSIKK